MDNEKIREGLQAIVTGLSQQAEGHAIQSRIFASLGYGTLAAKYAEHAAEERGYVERCVDRMLDLGGTVKSEAKQETPTYTDAVEWLRYDLQVSQSGLAWLSDIIGEARSDLTTFDLLKDYYQDEEKDMYWAKQQLELIEIIGVQNWLVQQL